MDSSKPRLSAFIQEHRAEILAAWEAFERDLPSTDDSDAAAFRTHAGAVLDGIVHDLETPETEEQRAAKARGDRDVSLDAATAASQHGLRRAISGVSVGNMVAEFRALRASVIGLWGKLEGQAGPADLEEMIRFNEAIDQAIAESLAQHSRSIETVRDRFLAVLGHDLRTPIGAVLTASQLLQEIANLTDDERKIVAGMERSARRMIELVRDLLDLALTRFGEGIPIKRSQVDLGAVARDVVAEVAASNHDARIDVETSGNLVGAWDAARLSQALNNLVGNAVQHGARGAAIQVAVRGEQPDTVSIRVSNKGAPIRREEIAGLFDPMKGGADARRDRRHLGLGLYIVDKIIEAHGGSIDVQSSEVEGTTFVVSLPRGRVSSESGSAMSAARR